MRTLPKIFGWITICGYVLFPLITFAQTLPDQALIYLSFQEADQPGNKSEVMPDEATYSVDLMRQQYAPGVKDYALDLTANAQYRRPWILDSLQAKQIQTQASFSVEVWVKTLADAAMGTPIAGNKKHNEPATAGWQLYSQENGAWALTLSDGKAQYAYRPTSRQQINDGQWHQLVFSIERPKNEVRMYRDGKAVAIYNLGELGDLASPLQTVIGGSDEYMEWGSAGQWKAFNGMLDEVKIWNRPLSAQEIQAAWHQHRPNPIPQEPALLPSQLRVMVWNIWHGGRRYGEQVGLGRTIEVLQESQADVICLIETYGSGEKIADALGYQLYLISSNLSILSRFPITETIEVFRPFNAGGLLLELAPGQEVRVINTWLHYLPDYLKAVNEQQQTEAELIAAEGETRHAEVQAILTEIMPQIQKQATIGTLMVGDFNSGSHLDWIADTRNIHRQYEVEWPVSKEMEAAGFRDSYRELHINPAMDPGYTWTPRAATSSDKYGIRDRIDYIYYQGDRLHPIFSQVVDFHPIMWPSDHAAVFTIFQLK